MKAFVLLLIMLVTSPALAAEHPGMITVTGTAEKDVMPDQARLNVTVQAKDRELKTAKAMHDEKMQVLFQIAGEMQIAQKDLKTQYAHTNPQYRYDKGEQYLTGYIVSTSLQVTIRKIDTVGELLERLAGAEFDRIGGVSYVVDNDRDYSDEVLVMALEHAKTKAKKMAESLGQTLGRPLQISEGYAQHKPQPIMMERAMMMSAAPMMDGAGGGVAPPSGTTKITGTVTASFALEE